MFTSPEFLTKKIKNGKAPAKKTSTMTKPLVVVNLQEDSDSDDFVPAVPKRAGNARGKKAGGNKENVPKDDSDDPFKEKSRKRKTTNEPLKVQEKKRECHDILELFRKGKEKKGSSNRNLFHQERGAAALAPILRCFFMQVKLQLK